MCSFFSRSPHLLLLSESEASDFKEQHWAGNGEKPQSKAAAQALLCCSWVWQKVTTLCQITCDALVVCEKQISCWSLDRLDVCNCVLLEVYILSSWTWISLLSGYLFLLSFHDRQQLVKMYVWQHFLDWPKLIYQSQIKELSGTTQAHVCYEQETAGTPGSLSTVRQVFTLQWTEKASIQKQAPALKGTPTGKFYGQMRQTWSHFALMTWGMFVWIKLRLSNLRLDQLSSTVVATSFCGTGALMEC